MTEKLSKYRISNSEYDRICAVLGRPPEGVEWALFSALWSEHCSYKSSRHQLKKFANTLDSKVVNASGENAGIVDLGFGEKIVFKMESHNHPSFIEPYQGAATGVGGILRDIFTMGARPIANANFLCFGEPESTRMHELVDGVVRGIGGYGNCVGVPTVTGFTEFHESYNNNILVNAMSVGLLRPGEKIALSGARGVGNLVVYVGAKTGKDGVHGAAMASESFDVDSDSKKPNVQIGDPYFEKLLIESCLEVLQLDLVVAIQDMGAAGLTSSSFEMSSKGKLGMNLDLSKVPLRDSTMTPEEILLSESQERMLLVCEPEKLRPIQDVFARWGLDAVVVGDVTADPEMKLFWQGELLCKINPDLLVEEAPRYERPFRPWDSPKKTASLPTPELSVKEVLNSTLKSAMGSTRQPIFRQFDQRVGAMTARGCESSIAFQRLPDSGRGLAIAVGCRPHLMRLDARIGALDAVIYPSLQMAVKGARAIAVTDCLNFGNPEKIEIMSEFVASVDAITEAAKVFETPVISGNVSFYNETMNKNITSTPATGLIGVREHVNDIPFDQFTGEGNFVYIFSAAQLKHNSSNFTGSLDLKILRSFANQCVEIANKKAVISSRVVGRGGLLMALTRHSLGGMGIKLETAASPAELLDEVLYQVIFELDYHRQDEVLRLFRLSEDMGFACQKLGRVRPGSLDLLDHGQFDIKEIHESYEQGFLKILT